MQPYFILALSAALRLALGCESEHYGGRNPSRPGYGYQGQAATATPRHGPPPHAPAYGYRAKHQYLYYPDSEVYYDPGRELYFYLHRDGHWQAGAHLPGGIRIDVGEGVRIEVNSDAPYTEFEVHRKQYPSRRGHGNRGRGRGRGHGRK